MGIMLPVYHYFTYNGKSSRDFEVWISGGGTYNSPVRDITKTAVPGRNGELTIDNGRFKNLDIKYPAFIVKDFLKNFDAFKAFLNAQRGYKKLIDTYNPEYYRLARFEDALEPEMATLNRAGSFDIVFDCDPRRFLIKGGKPITMTASGTVKNRTLYEAKPLIRCYGTGTIGINGTTITVNSANDYTDLDSEIEAAYKGSTNCNSNITFGNAYKTFPTLQPGDNSVTISGFSSIVITPNYWTV